MTFVTFGHFSSGFLNFGDLVRILVGDPLVLSQVQLLEDLPILLLLLLLPKHLPGSETSTSAVLFNRVVPHLVHRVHVVLQDEVLVHLVTLLSLLTPASHILALSFFSSSLALSLLHLVPVCILL